MFSVTRSMAGVLLCLSFLVAGRAADWPQWRGPDRNGHVPAGVAVPNSLPAEPRVLWRTKLGDGLASPVVSGGKVFYLDNQSGKETIHAADANTGAEHWSAAIDDAFKDIQSASGPRCTPLVEGNRVYAQSCKGELQCLSANDGKPIWRVNYVKDFDAVFIGEKGSAAGASRHGYNGSPLMDGAHLIAAAGGTNGASVVCLDKLTGKPIWKSQSDIPGYAPPVIATLAGVRQVICFTAEALIGVDRRDGRLLWRSPIKTSLGRHVTTPVIVDDMVVVASHQYGLVGVKISRDDDALKAGQAWVDKNLAINFSSPVTVGHHLYGLGPARNILCVDVTSGRLAWSKNGYFSSSADKAHASFLVMGENILILTDAGQLVMIAADPKECREIGRAQVCGFNWCNPAYASGRLYLRDARELLCVELLP